MPTVFLPASTIATMHSVNICGIAKRHELSAIIDHQQFLVVNSAHEWTSW